MSFFERIRHPYVLMTLAALFWSGNMVVARAVREDVPPVALAYWRWVVTLALTLPFAWPHLRVQWPAVRANWRVLVGASGNPGHRPLQYFSLCGGSAHHGDDGVAAQCLHTHRDHSHFLGIPS